jgi:hypothetical protein
MPFSSTPSRHAPSRVPARQGRAWIWFFTILVVLTIAAITIQIWYNSQQQLTAEQLAAAQRLWKEKGPADYDLEYTKKVIDATEVYHVKVRKGQVVSSTRDGQPEEERLYHYRDIPHLFGDIEEFWRQDHPEGQNGQEGQPPNRAGEVHSPRVFATAVFDPEDGHVLHYVRSVASKRERVEITVELRRVAAAP